VTEEGIKKRENALWVLAAGCCAACVASAAPDVRLGGAIGERFDAAVRGNVLKHDLEVDVYTHVSPCFAL